MVYKNFTDVLVELTENAPTEKLREVLQAVKDHLTGYSPESYYRAVALTLAGHQVETTEESSYLELAAHKLIRKADSLARHRSSKGSD